MISAFSILMVVVEVPLALATLVLFVEVAAATWTTRADRPLRSDVERPSIVVLLPAHNEGSGLLPTLDDVMGQLNSGDRVLVVADNCDDDTAAIAKAAGAEVIERNDLAKIGKGYALDFGFRYLQDDIPEVVIVVDADCRLEEGAINELALTSGSTGRPAQALYVMTAPDGADLGYRVAEFAWRIKNDLRPRGLAALGLPCQLMGSGMVFPRNAICTVDLATGDLVEDLALGLQLAIAGHPPLFCPAAVVTSEFPSTREAAATQRQRWEHGHLSVIVKRLLPYLCTALRSFNWDLFFLCLDAAVPPLVLLALLVATAFALSLIGILVGGPVAPLILGSAALMFFGSSILLAWRERGRDLLPPTALGSIFPYIGGKFGIYARAIFSEKKWVRTDRSKPDRKGRASKPDPNLR